MTSTQTLTSKLRVSELDEAVEAYLSGVKNGYKMESLVSLIENQTQRIQTIFWNKVDKGLLNLYR